MDLIAVDKLVSTVIEKVGPDKAELNSAIDIVLDFTDKNSLSPQILLELATVCERKGMYREEYVFAKACSLQASGKLQNDARFITGVMAYLLGFLEESESEYRQLLTENPEHIAARCNYGSLLIDLERFEEAEGQYVQALAVNPDHVSTRCNYAYLLVELGRLEEAEKEYRASI